MKHGQKLLLPLTAKYKQPFQFPVHTRALQKKPVVSPALLWLCIRQIPPVPLKASLSTETATDQLTSNARSDQKLTFASVTQQEKSKFTAFLPSQGEAWCPSAPEPPAAKHRRKNYIGWSDAMLNLTWSRQVSEHICYLEIATPGAGPMCAHPGGKDSAVNLNEWGGFLIHTPKMNSHCPFCTILLSFNSFLNRCSKSFVLQILHSYGI